MSAPTFEIAADFVPAEKPRAPEDVRFLAGRLVDFEDQSYSRVRHPQELADDLRLHPEKYVEGFEELTSSIQRGWLKNNISGFATDSATGIERFVEIELQYPGKVSRGLHRAAEILGRKKAPLDPSVQVIFSAARRQISSEINTEPERDVQLHLFQLG